MAREKHYVLNGFCKDGKHEECKGRSKGSRSDPHDFICTCPCHPWNKPELPRDSWIDAGYTVPDSSAKGSQQ